jgi:hypothetical protein
MVREQGTNVEQCPHEPYPQSLKLSPLPFFGHRSTSFPAVEIAWLGQRSMQALQLPSNA